MKDTRGVAIDHEFAERTTFIVGSNGKVLATIGGVSPFENVNSALKFVQELPKGK
jgi:peroxiredoxin